MDLPDLYPPTQPGTRPVPQPDTYPIGLEATQNRVALSDPEPEAELVRHINILASLWDESNDAVLVADAGNRIVSVNPEFERVTGYRENEVVGQPITMVISDQHDAAFHQHIWDELRIHGRWHGEVLNRRKDGSIYPERLKIVARKDRESGAVLNYVAIFSDLTSQKLVQRRVAHLSSHDQLTGLPNQILLRDRAEQAMAQCKGSDDLVALLILDLDHFKAVNDSIGHAGGDQLLRQISRALMSVASPTETVSRRGGDEFVFLFPKADTHTLRLMAQRVLIALADPFMVNGREAVVSASIGVSVYPTDGHDFDALLNNAESAMYKAKESGRRCVRFFTEEMNEGGRDRMALLGGLTRAAERGELRLHYQPLVNLATSEIVGAEALVRWERPGFGLVPPIQFIPLAESTGLIVDIGQWVLHEACQQLQRWAQDGLGHLQLAVNVSAMQFRQGILERQVNDALQRSGCDPKRLELELTESTLMVQPDEVMESIQRLKQRGIQLAIDDFGTGYSSLAYLRRLAVDKIKIDQSFVRDIAADADGAAIVRAIIQMARSLGLRTLGEGVETQVSRRALQVLGCDYAQGYYFGRPVPAEEFEQQVKRGRAQAPGSA